jgi:tripartite-type tricarboxylate transporter receptor subunit TctC
MELVIILLLICFILWIVWKVRANMRAEKNAALDDAWRTVLSDPDYAQRRQHEERKLYEARNRK